MEGQINKPTFQATWRSLAKWFPTARFISGSSVLFTLFNCLTVPVYAVSLPILSASIKRLSFPSMNEHLEFASSHSARCWMWSNKTCLSSILQASRSYPGSETRSINTYSTICVRVYVCVFPFSSPAASWFSPDISKWEAWSSISWTFEVCYK